MWEQSVGEKDVGIRKLMRQIRDAAKTTDNPYLNYYNFQQLIEQNINKPEGEKIKLLVELTRYAYQAYDVKKNKDLYNLSTDKWLQSPETTFNKIKDYFKKHNKRTGAVCQDIAFFVRHVAELLGFNAATVTKGEHTFTILKYSNKAIVLQQDFVAIAPKHKLQELIDLSDAYQAHLSNNQLAYDPFFQTITNGITVTPFSKEFTYRKQQHLPRPTTGEDCAQPITTQTPQKKWDYHLGYGQDYNSFLTCYHLLRKKHDNVSDLISTYALILKGNYKTTLEAGLHAERIVTNEKTTKKYSLTAAVYESSFSIPRYISVVSLNHKQPKHFTLHNAWLSLSYLMSHKLKSTDKLNLALNTGLTLNLTPMPRADVPIIFNTSYIIKNDKQNTITLNAYGGVIGKFGVPTDKTRKLTDLAKPVPFTLAGVEVKAQFSTTTLTVKGEVEKGIKSVSAALNKYINERISITLSASTQQQHLGVDTVTNNTIYAGITIHF
jgi:hypothetical protein